MLLKDKIVAISGAAGARGIGFATAKLFASHGATVDILDMDASASSGAAKAIGDGAHIGMACAVADKRSCERADAQIVHRISRHDRQFNNASFNQPIQTLEN